MLSGDLSLCQVKGHHSQLQAPCRADEESPAPIVVAVVLFYLGRVLQAWLPFWDSQWKSTFSQASCSAPIDLPRLSLSLFPPPLTLFIYLFIRRPLLCQWHQIVFWKGHDTISRQWVSLSEICNEDVDKSVWWFFSFQICRKIIRNPDKEGSGGLFGYRSVS